MVYEKVSRPEMPVDGSTSIARPLTMLMSTPFRGWTDTIVSGSPSGSMSLPSASMRTRTPADVEARSSRATGGRSVVLGSTMVTRTVASASSP